MNNTNAAIVFSFFWTPSLFFSCRSNLALWNVQHFQWPAKGLFAKLEIVANYVSSHKIDFTLVSSKYFIPMKFQTGIFKLDLKFILKILGNITVRLNGENLLCNTINVFSTFLGSTASCFHVNVMCTGKQ